MEDIDLKTGKLTKEHLENCSGCALCEPEEVEDDDFYPERVFY